MKRFRFIEEHVEYFETHEDFRKEHPDAGILFIDEKPCHGLCEGCLKPILEGDTFTNLSTSEDGDLLFCEECGPTEECGE